MRSWWKYVMRERLRKLGENASYAAAKLLPRSVKRWAYIQVVADATSGVYSNTEVPALGAMEALSRWEPAGR